MSKRNGSLYLLVLILIAAVLTSALGGGLFSGKEFWPLQWQHRIFAHVCHQIPDRSFWIAGQPMAVCSRCFGIYAGFALGWLLLPVTGRMNVARLMPFKRILLAAVLINLADIIGNFLGFWENTLTSRLILGCMLGIAAAVLFTGVFFNNKIKSTGNNYGRITTSGF